MINTIYNKIVTLVKTLDDIKEVCEFPQGNPKGYPYAWITWDTTESSELTNREDSVFITYKITLVQEKIEELKGRKNAEITTKDRAWKIEELFRENNDLGMDGVLRVLPVNTIKRYDASATRIIIETIIRVHIISEVKVGD